MKVLVVDDSKTQRVLLTKSLEKLELKLIIEEADNGRAALSLLEADFADADLVISDWSMPDMDGMELLTEMRDRNIDIPFAFITSNLTPQFIKKAEEVGAKYFISKPHSEKVLAEILSEVSN